MIVSNFFNTVWAYRESPKGAIWLYAEEPKYSEIFGRYISSAVVGVAFEEILKEFGIDATSVQDKPQPIEVNIKIETYKNV